MAVFPKRSSRDIATGKDAGAIGEANERLVYCFRKGKGRSQPCAASAGQGIACYCWAFIFQAFGLLMCKIALEEFPLPLSWSGGVAQAMDSSTIGFGRCIHSGEIALIYGINIFSFYFYAYDKRFSSIASMGATAIQPWIVGFEEFNVRSLI